MSQEKKPGLDNTPALKRLREELRRLEQSLRHESQAKEKLRKKIEQLEDENKRLKEEIKALRGLPDWVKPDKGAPSRKRTKKKGPKIGHVAKVRKKPEQIDQEIKIIPQECPECKREDLPDPSQWHTHIQIDLPPPSRPVVTRYHVGWSWCRNCNKLVSGQGRIHNSQYGPFLHGQVSYWKYHLGLSLGKIEQLLKEQYQLSISTGSLSEMLQRVGRELGNVYTQLQTDLREQRHLHADETGWRVDGNNGWLWSFSNEQLSYYHVDRSRGQKVVASILGESFSGVLASDFYSAYEKIVSNKQKCWAHLLREIRELKKKWPKRVEYKKYGKQLKRFYQRAVVLQEDYEAGKNMERRYQRLFNDTIQFAQNPQSDAELKRLSKRLLKYRAELYTFIKAGISGTNNAAEREIRPAVLMRKISYGNRSDQGAQTQAVLMSVIRTWQRQGLSFAHQVAKYLAPP